MLQACFRAPPGHSEGIFAGPEWRQGCFGAAFGGLPVHFGGSCSGSVGALAVNQVRNPTDQPEEKLRLTEVRFHTGGFQGVLRQRGGATFETGPATAILRACFWASPGHPEGSSGWREDCFAAAFAGLLAYLWGFWAGPVGSNSLGLGPSMRNNPLPPRDS